MLEQLQKRFNSAIKSFEIFYTIKGIKPAARIMVFEDNLKDIINFLKKQRLAAITSNFKVEKADRTYGYSDKSVKLDRKSDKKGYFFVYSSKDKKKAKQAMVFEEEDNHLELGRMLGYPECCCEFFKRKIEEKKIDMTLDSLESSKGYVLPFLANNAARHFDLSLISHFPCSFNCEKTKEIAEKNLAVIEGVSTEIAAVLRGMLKEGIIYTENEGIFLLRKTSMKENCISYGGVMGTKNSMIYSLLKSNNKVQVISKNEIRIGDKELGGKGIGVMYFV